MVTKKNIDYIIMGIFYTIFSPFVILHVIAYCLITFTKFLFEKILNPLYNKLCKFIRGTIPNSTVHVKGIEDNYFKRINEKLLTIKEAKKLAKEYKDKGYEVHTSLSEF